MSLNSLRIGGVPEHFNLPWRLACEQRFFSDVNLPVRFLEYPGGTGELVSALEQNDLEIAVCLLEGAVKQIAHGTNFKIAKLYTESPLVWGIHVSAKSSFENVGDLQGRRYAISRNGSGSHLIAIVDAAERGWPIQSMNFVVVDNLAGARRALANDQADVFLWEKTMTKPIVDAGEFRRVDERVVPWPAFVIAVRNDVLENKRDEVEQVLKKIGSSCALLKSDPAACEVIAHRYDLLRSDVQDWLESTCWSDHFEPPKQGLSQAIKYLKVLNLIPHVPITLDDLWFRFDRSDTDQDSQVLD